jgi:hypothetical protein
MCQHYLWHCTACRYHNMRAFRCPAAQQRNATCASKKRPQALPPSAPPQVCDGCGIHIRRSPLPRGNSQPGFHQAQPIPGTALNTPPCKPHIQPSIHSGCSIPTPPMTPERAHAGNLAFSPLPLGLGLHTSFWRHPPERLPENAAVLALYRRERERVLTGTPSQQIPEVCRPEGKPTGLSTADNAARAAWEKLTRTLVGM